MFPKIGGTPKSSILIGFSIVNHPFWGTPIFGNTHIYFILLQLASGSGRPIRAIDPKDVPYLSDGDATHRDVRPLSDAGRVGARFSPGKDWRKPMWPRSAKVEAIRLRLKL